MSNDKHWEALGFKTKEEYEIFHNCARQEMIADAIQEDVKYGNNVSADILKRLEQLPQEYIDAFFSSRCNRESIEGISQHTQDIWLLESLERNYDYYKEKDGGK